MKSSLRHAVALFAVSLVAVAAPGCSEVAAELDCDSICDNLKECFDAELDASTCRSNCVEVVKDDEALRERANECDDCLDEQDTCALRNEKCTTCPGVRASFVP